MKIIGLNTKTTIKTDKKHHFIFNIYELWPHRNRSAMITASQFTAALVFSRSDGDFEPSGEVFQQWASYAGGIEPKIHQLVKGRKTRKVKTKEICRGKIVTTNRGNIYSIARTDWVSTIAGTIIKHNSLNQHAIFDKSAVILWSAVSVLQHSSEQKTLVVPAEHFRWRQLLSALHQATQTEIPSTSS